MISLVGYDQACGRTEENIWKRKVCFSAKLSLIIVNQVLPINGPILYLREFMFSETVFINPKIRKIVSAIVVYSSLAAAILFLGFLLIFFENPQ